MVRYLIVGVGSLGLTLTVPAALLSLVMLVALCVLVEAIERPLLTLVFRTVLLGFLLLFLLLRLLLLLLLLPLVVPAVVVVQERLLPGRSCPPISSVHRARVGTLLVQLSTAANLTTAKQGSQTPGR